MGTFRTSLQAVVWSLNLQNRTRPLFTQYGTRVSSVTKFYVVICSTCLLFFQFLSICKKGSSSPESTVAGIVLILFLLGLMLVLIYCFNHEERLELLCQQHVVERCRDMPHSKFNVQDKLKRMVSWLTMVEKYRKDALPKKQTITIRFENLSLVLKKVKFRCEQRGR